MALMAMPASSMVDTEVPADVVARRYTSSTATKPPAKAPRATRDMPSQPPPSSAPPNTTTKPAPAEAPLATPIRDGSARGLRKSPCITAPAPASTSPSRAARISRGRRMAKRMRPSRP